jgi:hypothetical protein
MMFISKLRGFGPTRALLSYGLARVLNSVCLLLLAAWPSSAQTTPSLNEIVRNMERAECERLAQLPQYSDIRRYKFSSERFKKSSAEMLVRSKHYAGQGTDFEVLSSQGSDGISGRIFRHVMDAEREAGGHGENRVDSSNYNFELLGTESINGRECYKLKLLPKRKPNFCWKAPPGLTGRILGSCESPASPPLPCLSG